MNTLQEDVRLRGEEVVAALKEQACQQIIRVPYLYIDYGKFFFSVSIGSLGLMVTLLNLDSTVSDLGTGQAVSLSLFAVSILLALRMILPTDTSGPDTGLIEDYGRLVRKLRHSVYLWFYVWLTGVAVAIYSLSSRWNAPALS